MLQFLFPVYLSLSSAQRQLRWVSWGVSALVLSPWVGLARAQMPDFRVSREGPAIFGQAQPASSGMMAAPLSPSNAPITGNPLGSPSIRYMRTLQPLFHSAQSSDPAVNKTLNELERQIYGHAYGNEAVNNRLERLELTLFNAVQLGRTDQRLVRLTKRATVEPTGHAHGQKDQMMLTYLERRMFGGSFGADSMPARLDRMETHLFGAPQPQLTDVERVRKLTYATPVEGSQIRVNHQDMSLAPAALAAPPSAESFEIDDPVAIPAAVVEESGSKLKTKAAETHQTALAWDTASEFSAAAKPVAAPIAKKAAAIAQAPVWPVAQPPALKPAVKAPVPSQSPPVPSNVHLAVAKPIMTPAAKSQPDAIKPLAPPVPKPQAVAVSVSHSPAVPTPAIAHAATSVTPSSTAKANSDSSAKPSAVLPQSEEASAQPLEKPVLALTLPSKADPVSIPNKPPELVTTLPAAVGEIPSQALVSDYLPSIFRPDAQRALRWKTLPVKVYREPEPQLPAVLVNQAIQDWSDAVPIALVDRADLADIIVTGHQPSGSRGPLTYPIFRPNSAHQMQVVMLINLSPVVADLTKLGTQPADAKMLQAVVTHQMGHALGLWGHSQNEGDLLKPTLAAEWQDFPLQWMLPDSGPAATESEPSGSHTASITKPSQADLNTLKALYQLPALDIHQLSPFTTFGSRLQSE